MSTKKRKMNRHEEALGEQIEATKYARTKRTVDSDVGSKRSARTPDSFVDERMTRRILEEARKQQDEEERPLTHFEGSLSRAARDHYGSDHEDDSEIEEAGADADFDADEYYEEFVEDYDAEEVEGDLQRFMPSAQQPRRTLGDIIAAQIRDKEQQLASGRTGGVEVPRDLDPRVIQTYRELGKFLSTYRSGKIPKAFKVIPQLSNWEQILFITEPDNWSAAAMYAGTRLFVSNLKDKMCQRFLNLVLLPRIRDDIDEYKKLNYHLYQSLKKALFKPGAFFKAIVLPLCESGATLREAVIIGSVMAKVSIPMLHSAAALLKMAEMEYTGCTSIFLRTLMEKKYALPYRVIDALVAHFVRFGPYTQKMPVLWHLSLLTFVQRYKNDISPEQRDALVELTKDQSHDKITPEVRTELLAAKEASDKAVRMNTN